MSKYFLYKKDATVENYVEAHQITAWAMEYFPHHDSLGLVKAMFYLVQFEFIRLGSDISVKALVESDRPGANLQEVERLAKLPRRTNAYHPLGEEHRKSFAWDSVEEVIGDGTTS